MLSQTDFTKTWSLSWNDVVCTKIYTGAFLKNESTCEFLLSKWPYYFKIPYYIEAANGSVW